MKRIYMISFLMLTSSQLQTAVEDSSQVKLYDVSMSIPKFYHLTRALAREVLEKAPSRKIFPDVPPLLKSSQFEAKFPRRIKFKLKNDNNDNICYGIKILNMNGYNRVQILGYNLDIDGSNYFVHYSDLVKNDTKTFSEEEITIIEYGFTTT